MGLGYVISQARLASLKGKGLLNLMYKLFPIGMTLTMHTHALISEPWMVRALWPVNVPPAWKMPAGLEMVLLQEELSGFYAHLC